MKNNPMLPLLLSLAALLAAAGLYLRSASALEHSRAVTARLAERVSGLSDSLLDARRSIDSLREIAPGLGEFMTAIQLHAGKLWFAGRASNWGLAAFEVNEMEEAMEGAEALHAVRNNVKTAPVIAAVRETELGELGSAVKEGNGSRFEKKYVELLGACNDCHRTAGYPFLHIILPTAPPVTNQAWAPARP